MKRETAGGIALLGAAILGGYYLYTKNQSPETVDLGSSGLGTGGNTALTPSFVAPENVTSPYVETPDSMTIGIEDDGTAKENTGLTEISDAGTYDTSAEKVDGMAFLGELAPWGGLALVQSASKLLLKKGTTSAAGSFFSRFAAGTGAGAALKVVTRAVPVVSGIAFASDMLIGRAGDGGYTGVSAPTANSTIEDVVAAQMGAAKTVSGVEKVTSNYGSDASYQDLNAIAGTDSGTTWKSTYSSVKTGTSASKGLTTNTYQASSGQQVALAGISAADYASYLANKK
ncbi:MAG: hypothetical protein WC936_06580 [Candidatus Nanoarchaeia archaeon]|jgi:hypothetical protein